MEYCKHCTNVTPRLDEVFSYFEQDKSRKHKVVPYSSVTQQEMRILKREFITCDVSRGDFKAMMIVRS